MMICPVCNSNNIPDNSKFCNMCGVNLTDAVYKANLELEEKQRAGVIPMAEKTMQIAGMSKTIQVLCKDITTMNEDVDLLTISAYPYSYTPTPRSLIGALYRNLNISVEDLAKNPLLDIRSKAGCWISKEIKDGGHIKRIGGVEIPRNEFSGGNYENRLMKSVKSYMNLIDILTEYEPDMKVVVLPLLGSGDLHLNHELLIYPLINEVTGLLSRNKCIEKVILVERNFEKAQTMANALNSSYSVQTEVNEHVITADKERNVFISYTEKGDRAIADMLGNYLKERGIPYWYAPKDIKVGDYATEIVNGIKNCTHFICIISENSMKSTHVINEVDLAFKRLSEGVKIIPFRLDNSNLEPAFEYYLSRMNWVFCTPPPLENRIAELVSDYIETK